MRDVMFLTALIFQGGKINNTPIQEEGPILSGKSSLMLMDYMTTITDVEYDNDSFKPIKNHLLNLCGSLNKFQTEEEETLYGYVCSMIGGQLVHLRNGKQHYFYVNPYLTESDRNLITGAITANRYLSPEEKKYLTGVVESLNGFVGEEALDDNSAYQIIPEPMEAEITELGNEIPDIDPYDKVAFLNEVFMSGERYDTLVALLRHRKNIILQGAPGVGKTFAAKRLAWSIMGEQDESRIQFVQFHQNYAYEDFIMGYKPD
jgi:hypothetical protein